MARLKKFGSLILSRKAAKPARPSSEAAPQTCFVWLSDSSTNSAALMIFSTSLVWINAQAVCVAFWRFWIALTQLKPSGTTSVALRAMRLPITKSMRFWVEGTEALRFCLGRKEEKTPTRQMNRRMYFIGTCLGGFENK